MINEGICVSYCGIWAEFVHFGPIMCAEKVRIQFEVKKASNLLTLLFRPPLKSQNMNIQSFLGSNYANRADLAHFGPITYAEMGPKTSFGVKKASNLKTLLFTPIEMTKYKQ